VQFVQPSWLWLLWLLPPLAALYGLAASRRRAALRRFADERFLDGLVPGRSAGRNALRISLIGVALLLAIFSLAGPSWGFSWEKVDRRGIDLVVALDLSRSMLAQDVPPDRLAAARREIRDLLSLLQGDRVGLVVFAGSAFVQCPLTLDYNAFEVFLSQMDPTWVPVGGTDLGAAVRTSIDTFIADDRAGRAVVLITDGEDHGGQLREAAQEAKAEGVHVFVVGIGSPEGVPIPDGQGGFIKEDGRVVLSKLDEGALKELAMTTGGSYVRSVSSMADLEQIYLEDIKGTLEARALSSSRQRRAEERFQWFLLPVFLLLFAEPLFGPRRRRAGRRNRGGAAALLALVVLAAGLAAPATALAEDDHRAGYRAFKRGDFQGALDSWLSAQTDDPGDREVAYDIGQAHYRLGQYAEAEKAFMAASEGQDRELAADALYNAGNALFEQGRYLDAIAAYDRTLEIREDDEDALLNRDLAQRRYEELMEQARDEREQREQEQEEEPPPEDQQDADCENPQPGEEGEEGEQSQQEQKQGQGMSEQEQPKEGQGPEEDRQEQQEQPEGADDGQADQQQEVMAGQAEAADIDRESTPSEEQESLDGEVTEETLEEEGDPRPAHVIEGALTEEEAEELLQALRADQEQRRQQRTRRAAARGRRGAAKDW